MKISYSWLKKYLPKSYHRNPEEISELLTDIGLEVEGLEEIESIKGGLKGVVIGEIKELWKHPNADKLNCTKVDVGEAELKDIVCGAPNAAAGQKVIVATVGAMLYPTGAEEGFQIKKSKIRGEVSEGMICAEDEIGTGVSHDGILILPEDVKVGTSAAEYFNIESDWVFEIGLTPNRADAISHYGVARDLVAAFNIRENKNEKLVDFDRTKITSSFESDLKVSVKNTQKSPRYAGLVIKNLKVAPSPDWIQNSLRALGLTPKNNLVDITNYVNHAVGQPLHAFDLAEVEGNEIIVKSGLTSTFTTLDEVERTLDSEDLMICNAKAPMCIGGVFGGLKSGVKDSTEAIFLESAYFNPVSIRKTAKRHALNTDASYRFERGIDPALTIEALKLACSLIKEVCPEAKFSQVYDENTISSYSHKVSCNPTRASKLIGKNLSEKEIEKVLTELDITILEKGENWQLEVPAYRVDVTREADIAEELLRLYGFNTVELDHKINMTVAAHEKKSAYDLEKELSRYLVANGFNEAMNNSLSASKNEQLFDGNEDAEVRMLNPLSQDLDIMRQSLIPNLVNNVAYNINRQRKEIQFFEFGKTYFKYESGFVENHELALVISGKKHHKTWSKAERKSNFHDLKQLVDQIINQVAPSSKLKQAELEEANFDYGIQYKIGKQNLVKFGAVNEAALKQSDVKQEVFVALFNFEKLHELYQRASFKIQELAKFPEVRRDLSFLIKDEISYKDIENIVKQSERKLLKEIGMFDLYRGKNLEKGKKSYAIYMTFQDENKTLNDKVVEKSMGRIVDNLTKELAIEIRQ